MRKRRPAALLAAPALLAFAALLLAPALALAAPIRLWHAYRDEEAKTLEAVLATWKGEAIEPLSIPFDAYMAKLEAAIPLGEGPDLFIAAHERLGSFRERKLVAPVGDALESAAAFQGPALDAMKAGGETWGLPIGQKCIALYVNTQLVQEVPADLEGIAELKGKLPAGVYPLVYEAPNAYFHQAVLGGFGGEMLTKDDQFGFVGPAAERSLDFVLSLIRSKAVPEEPDGALVTDLFNSGHAAFVINGPWFVGSLNEETKKHYRVVPLPKLRASGQPMRPFATVEGVMITPRGAQRPDVRALARLIAGAEATALRLKRMGTPPVRTDVPVPADDAFVAAFTEQAKTAVPMPSSEAMSSVWEVARGAIRKVLRGDAPPPVALTEAKHRFDNVRRPLPPAASPLPLVLALGALALALAFRWVRAARDAQLGAAFSRSLPAYRWVAHAVLVVGVLVMAPLVIGAATSFTTGHDDSLRFVGFANFKEILTARGESLLSSGSFYLVLLVTVVWTALNVFFHVTIGVALALLLHRPTLRLRALYRVLLIVPWAVPSYVTALTWKGMFHRQYGAVTGLIEAANSLFGTQMEPISWFASFSTAFTANLTTNVWLGFPFMMVVTLGALTAVPDDVLEAAKVDGATRWQRLWLITLPMIRPTLAPAVTLGAIWTFNMFNVIYLVSNGDPDGTTDILVSEAYRWAFTRQGQYGYAAAYSVLIFGMLTAVTKLGERRRQRDAARPAVESGHAGAAAHGQLGAA